MTRAFLCNGPDCESVARTDEVADRWWSLGRNAGGLDHPLALGMMPTITLTDATEDPSERTEFDDLPPDMHFCSARCLVGWAEMAAAVE